AKAGVNKPELLP
nr:RecName: Full=Unknown protein from spot 106 of 2D-PAGE of thylakoid [Pisum sativum]